MRDCIYNRTIANYIAASKPSANNLSKKTPISRRHSRTRNDHANETAEDYVEAIEDIHLARGQCRVVDLAQRFGVSHVTVTKIVHRLQREGLVDTRPYKPVELTATGKRLATRSRRRHQIVVEFLLAIGVKPQIAAIDAEGIEHHVSPETLRKFEEFSSRTRRSSDDPPAS